MRGAVFLPGRTVEKIGDRSSLIQYRAILTWSSKSLSVSSGLGESGEVSVTLVPTSRLAGSDPDPTNRPTRTSVLPHHGSNLSPRCPPCRKQRSRHACNRNHYNRHQKRHGIGLRPVCPQVSQISWQSGAAMHRWARARASDQAGDRPGSRASFRSCRASRQHMA
jgi:hypothetical protein